MLFGEEEEECYFVEFFRRGVAKSNFGSISPHSLMITMMIVVITYEYTRIVRRTGIGYESVPTLMEKMSVTIQEGVLPFVHPSMTVVDTIVNTRGYTYTITY